MLNPYDYPKKPHSRRHGPDGYTAYERYRPWLRDEFCFRCVLCLHRERWPTTSEFEIDHLVPQSERPDLECTYTNLLYVCRRCNGLKSGLRVPDPCVIAYGECLRVNGDGSVEPLNDEGRRLIEILRLDRPERERQRRMIIEILTDAEQGNDIKRIRDWLGFPTGLDDLRRLKPPANYRREGVESSWYVLWERKELAETY